MLTVPRIIYDEMLAHAREIHPNECCGVMSGKNGLVRKLHPMTNTEHSPVRYLIDPKEQFAVFKEMRKAQTDLAVIFHSHPHTEAYPSKTDVALAYYPEALYMIISLKDKDPVVNAFRIVNEKITPEDFSVV